MFYRNQLKFLVIAVGVALTHCGKHDVAKPQPTSSPILNQPNPNINQQPASTSNVTTKPAPTIPPAAPKTTPIVEDNKAILKNLTPQGLAETKPNYDLANNNNVVAPAKKIVPTAPATSTVATTVPTKPSTVTGSSFFTGNETLGNLFSDYGNLNIDSNFNADDMKKILSATTITADRRDQVLKQFFKIVENNDPRIAEKISFHDRIQKVFDLYNLSNATTETDPQYVNNSRFAQILKERANAEDPNFAFVPADIQNKIAPMIYVIALAGKAYGVDIRQHLQLKPAGMLGYINQSIDPLKYDTQLLNSGINSLKDLTAEVDRRVDATLNELTKEPLLTSNYVIKILSDKKLPKTDSTNHSTYNRIVNLSFAPKL